MGRERGLGGGSQGVDKLSLVIRDNQGYFLNILILKITGVGYIFLVRGEGFTVSHLFPTPC